MVKTDCVKISEAISELVFQQQLEYTASESSVEIWEQFLKFQRKNFHTVYYIIHNQVNKT